MEAKDYFPNHWRIFLVSRVSWEESPFDEDVVFGLIDGTGVGTETTVEVVTCAGKTGAVVHVVTSPVAKGDEDVQESDNKSSSVPVSSCKAQVSCSVQLSIVPVKSNTTQEVTNTSPLREKWVHMVVLENVLRSNKSDWAAFGFIKR